MRGNRSERTQGNAVTNLLQSVSDDLIIVDFSLGGDFTEHHDHTSLGAGLAGDLGLGILSEAGVEDGVRDLIADLIRVTLVD